MGLRDRIDQRAGFRPVGVAETFEETLTMHPEARLVDAGRCALQAAVFQIEWLARGITGLTVDPVELEPPETERNI